MKLLLLFVLSVGAVEFDYSGLRDFPKDFIFGVATASYQIEGAWNEAGKGENIWDRLVHTTPQKIRNRDNGDIACDSYHKYKDDVQNIKNIGFNMYRFSFSWSRLFPSGYTNYTNPDGVRYYNALIDELIGNGIQPMGTLYHWDLPQPLQDIGGWLNPEIAYIFGEYARAVFNLFGDKVKWWVPINEPKSVTFGYTGIGYAPALNLHGTGEYLSAHNLIRAHAKAYNIYKREFKNRQKGRVGYNLSGIFNVARNKSDPSHLEAAERANQFLYGWFGHPVFSKEGDYPQVMREYVDKASASNQSRLPYFTKEEIEEIRGTWDYLALNHYSTRLSEPGTALTAPEPSIDRDQEVILSINSTALQSACSWLQVTPEGFRELLNWIKRKYGNPEVFITENGYCDEGGIDDQPRVYYYSEYLKQLLAALNQDKCNIVGYTAWSLMDNFEWLEGYTSKFGLLEVDFSNPNRTRTFKKSANFFKGLFQTLHSSSAPSNLAPLAALAPLGIIVCLVLR